MPPKTSIRSVFKQRDLCGGGVPCDGAAALTGAQRWQPVRPGRCRAVVHSSRRPVGGWRQSPAGRRGDRARTRRLGEGTDGVDLRRQSRRSARGDPHWRRRRDDPGSAWTGPSPVGCARAGSIPGPSRFAPGRADAAPGTRSGSLPGRARCMTSCPRRGGRQADIERRYRFRGGSVRRFRRPSPAVGLQ